MIFQKPINSPQIIEKLKTDGFIKIDSCFTDKFINSINGDIADNRFTINKNRISGVFSNKQFFFVHLLTLSQSFVNLIMDKSIQTICKKYFQTGCRLKAMRYYETSGMHKMQWHTDNKTSEGFSEVNGLIFIFYCNNVSSGEFQYIKGSHLWSLKQKKNDFTDEWIKKNYSDSIESFKGPSGTLIIYNSHGIHRAKPFKNRFFVRKSVFFQIDDKLDDGEQLLVNPSLFSHKNMTDTWTRDFLGFESNSTYAPYPKSSVKTLPSNVFLPLVIEFIAQKLKSIFKRLIPNPIKLILKRVLKSTTQ